MNIPHVYRFDERLAMSHGVDAHLSVETILWREIPGAEAVYPASKDEDHHGTDWWVEINGHRLSVDCKVREEDWALKGEDDLAIEIWSVIEQHRVGWSRDPQKRANYILWLWKDTGRWCLVPFLMLCAVTIEHWETWQARYRTAVQYTTSERGNWHSQCIFVPRLEVWREIYRRFGGKPQ